MCYIQSNKMQKVCSKCKEEKLVEEFISRDRCICKVCKNLLNREKYKSRRNNVDPELIKTCIRCECEKSITEFIYSTNRCKECNNILRREKYYNDIETSTRIQAEARDYKRRKTEAKQKVKAEEKSKLEAEIGEDNIICKYCKEIVLKTHFRHNRLKCKDCERDDPKDKFKRVVRTRIWWCLDRKEMHTIEYLGCNFDEYERWIANYSTDFTMENRGTIWHIDHVIPLSRFDLNDPVQQLTAFNWRNTAPLLAKENLAKNCRIIPSQIEQHLAKLIEYHKTHNIDFPLVFSNLFAT